MNGGITKFNGENYIIFWIEKLPIQHIKRIIIYGFKLKHNDTINQWHEHHIIT